MEQRNNELMHYGVMGMKWGVRRANKNASKAASSTAKAKQYRTEGNTKEATKYSKKAQKYNNRSKGWTKIAKGIAGDDKTYNRVKNTSTGKAVAQSMLLGSYGALKYNQSRAKGRSRGASAVVGRAYNTLNDATYGLVSGVDNYHGIKKQYNKKRKK